MTEQTEDKEPKKKLSLSRPGKLELNKTVGAGQVRQNFSHGRSKSVTVEVRRKRTFTQAADGDMTEVKETDTAAVEEEAPIKEEAVQTEVKVDEPVTAEDQKAKALRVLTGEERAARARALSGAQHTVTMATIRAEEDAKRAGDRAEESRKLAEEEAKRKQLEETERLRAETEMARKAAEDAAMLEARASKSSEAEPGTIPKAKLRAADAATQKPAADEDEEGDEKAAEARKRPEQRRLTAKRGEPRRRSTGKLTMAQALDDEERTRSLASLRRSRERERRALRQPGEAVKILHEVVIPETITVQELANRMAERAVDVTKSLMKMGVMATMGQAIDADTAELVVAEFGHTAKRVSAADVEIGIKGAADSDENLESRPAVVTVMGHVDHGKTSLLDALRSTNVVAGEAGGITQHIGAYQVDLPAGERITFVDTPGHEAFTAMRARGANVTDIVVLVVAADDGIMPQTIEAIDHAKAAQVPIIVAINKIDRPDADVAKVRNELLQHELIVEELGGDILAVEVSATVGTNLDKLVEAIVLQAEVLELKSNPNRSAEGVVIEAQLEHGRGAVATLLVQRGSLDVGDIVVAGQEWGRIRAITDDKGVSLNSATPSMPVEVLGLGGAPLAGDEFSVVENEARARDVTEFREQRERDRRMAANSRGTAEDIFARISEGVTGELPIIVKADAQGSIEAIIASAIKMGTDEVAVRVLHSGVGGINESDITLAGASNALVIGFNVRANPQARELAQRDGTEMRYYSVIYQVLDDIKAMLSGMLPPLSRENFLGNAAIQEVFNISKIGKIAGCRITEGVVKRGASVRLLRDNVVIHEGTLATLKHFKDEVREVRAGTECGMAFENYYDLRANDVIECFEVEEIARTL
ncbi:MAG: translation initiation factor IF-2 [Rhodospirillales bacterium]|nr:translation initiation factor IF-2 [Rhodospirillales bacterium]